MSADIYIRARAPVFLLASFTPCAAARRSVCPRRIRDAVPKYSPSIHAQTYLTILYHDRGLRLRLNLEVVINYYNRFFFTRLSTYIYSYTHIKYATLYFVCTRTRDISQIFSIEYSRIKLIFILLHHWWCNKICFMQRENWRASIYNYYIGRDSASRAKFPLLVSRVLYILCANTYQHLTYRRVYIFRQYFLIINVLRVLIAFYYLIVSVIISSCRIILSVNE